MTEETLSANEQALLELARNHTSLGNNKARQLLGWDEATYEHVRQALVAKGQVAIGRGRGGSISVVGAGRTTPKPGGSLAAEPIGLMANGQTSTKPPPVTYPKRGRPPKAKAKGQEAKGLEANGQKAPKPKGLKAKGPKTPKPEKDKSLETWIWDAACSIRGAKDAPKYKDYILPLIFTKRLCDVFDDELDRIAAEVGSREKPSGW
jgi:hypothetical protein